MLFSKNIIRDINNTSTNMLSQTSYAADIIFEQVLQITNQLLSDNSIATVLDVKLPDLILEYQVISKLKCIQNSYSALYYIGLYNEMQGRYITSRGIRFSSNNDVSGIIPIVRRATYWDFMPREVTLFSSQQEKPTNVLTFFLFHHPSSSFQSKGIITINIDESYIQKMIKVMAGKSQDTIMILDSKGIVLSHTSGVHFRHDFSKYPYIKRILTSESSSGYFTQKVDSNKNIVTFVKSNKLGWFFISTKSYHSVFSNIYRLLSHTISLGIILILSGIALSVFLTKKFANPLHELISKVSSLVKSIKPRKKVNEFEYLSNAFSEAINKASRLEYSLETAYPAMQNMYYQFLLNGKNDKLLDSIKVIKNIEGSLIGPYYSVLLILIDSYKTCENGKLQNKTDILKISIGNLSQVLLNNLYISKAIYMLDGQTAILLQIEEPVLKPELILSLKEIQNVIKTKLDLSISISIGDIVSERNRIHESYQSAITFSKYRLFYGNGCIIDYDKVKNRLNNMGEYPQEIEKKIRQAIHICDKRSVEKEVENFLTAISQFCYSSALIYCNQLSISIIKHFHALLEAKGKEPYRTLDILKTSDTIKEISGIVKNVFLQICDILKEKERMKNIGLIDEIKQYIVDNYVDPGLCLELVAEKIHISSGYLGKLFKQFSSYSFHDYANMIRLEKAKELFINTDLPVSQISQKVGIINTTYFFTLFKKKYGMTPSQYRKHIFI